MFSISNIFPISALYLDNESERLNKIIAKHTGKTFKQVEKDTDRDNYMSAEEALAYGLVDKIIK